MNQTIRNFGKKALRATAIATATIIALLLLTRKLNTDWLEAERTIAEQFQFSDLFFKWHSPASIPSCNERDLHVIDINSCKSRGELATLFDSITAAQPYLVALDIKWGQYALSDSIEDSLLVAAVSRLPNLILAEEVVPKDSLNHASFIDKVHATEALINLPNNIIRTWKTDWLVKEDTILTFAAAIANKMGASLLTQQQDWLIDYSIPKTPVMSSNQVVFSVLRDNVVIIGDVQDERDAFIVPATFSSNMQLTGVLVHRQIVQTILSGNWIREVSRTTNWIVIYLVIWLFLFTEIVISDICTCNDSIKQATAYIIKIIILIILIFVAYILFWAAHLYINVWGGILAPAMIWTGKLIVEAIDIMVHHCKQIKPFRIKKGKKK